MKRRAGLLKVLKRGIVFNVAIAYAISSWLLAQVADLVLEKFAAPSWGWKGSCFPAMEVVRRPLSRKKVFLRQNRASAAVRSETAPGQRMHPALQIPIERLLHGSHIG